MLWSGSLYRILFSFTVEITTSLATLPRELLCHVKENKTQHWCLSSLINCGLGRCESFDRLLVCNCAVSVPSAMAAVQHKLPSWHSSTAKTERHGVTTSLGGLSARNAVSSSYLSRNRGSALPQRAVVQSPTASPTVRCTQSQVDSAALDAAPASRGSAVTASQPAADPLLLVAPESLSYPSGFLGARQEESVGAGGSESSEVAADSLNLDGYLRMILTSRVYDVAVETALEFAPKLSDRTGNRVFLKREDTQPVWCGVRLNATASEMRCSDSSCREEEGAVRFSEKRVHTQSVRALVAEHTRYLHLN